MTTTVTVTTHAFPIAVTTNDDHSHFSPERQSFGSTTTTEFVPAESERQFHLSNTRSLHFRELPIGAVDLDGQKAAATV